MADDNTVTLYVGTESEPADRTILLITQADMDKLPRGSKAEAEVTDLNTGRKYLVHRVSCGLPGCMCAVDFVKLCPDCEGAGGWTDIEYDGFGGGRILCETCKGKGRVAAA